MTKEQKTQSGTQAISALVERVASEVADAFRMEGDEKERFMAKDIARLIAAIPFLAECEDAERTAVSHLGAYVLSCRETKHVYNATPGDNASIFERLRLIYNFKGGNRQIIDKGMSILALIMLTDYKNDIEIDAAVGKYNPVGDGTMDYNAVREELLDKINAVECVQMDNIFNAGPGIQAFWGW